MISGEVVRACCAFGNVFSMHNWFGLILVWVGQVYTSILIAANPDWPVHVPPTLQVVSPNVVHFGARNCLFQLWFLAIWVGLGKGQLREASCILLKGLEMK